LGASLSREYMRDFFSMILTAYIDESGTHDTSPVTVMPRTFQAISDGPLSTRSGKPFLRALASTTFTPSTYSMEKSLSIIFPGHGASKLLKKLKRSP